MARISEAEREARIAKCVELVGQGLTHEEIAKRLGISLPTVSNYLRIARRRGLLRKDEEDRFLSDFKDLVENAPVIESLVSHIDFSRSPQEVLKQVKHIKELYWDEFDALGYLAIIFEIDAEERDRRLKALGVDIENINQIRARFANILKYAKVLFLKDNVGIENEWRWLRVRNLLNLTRDELLVEVEIHTDLTSFKTRDRLDSLLKLIARLLLHCGRTIHELSKNRLPVDPDQLERSKKNLRLIEKILQKAFEDLERRK